jgi:hypothetical protein
MMNRERLLASVVGALVAAAIAGGVAYATIPAPDNVYSACMLKSLGTIRLIDKSLPSTNLMSHCTGKETEISWNQAGQPGPQGAKGEQGTPGANGTNGKDGKDGVGVTSAAEPAGINCANGGSKFIAANGASYACNGAPGGPPGSGLKTIAGQVAADGTVMAGTGFSVSLANGGYRINFPAGTWTGCSSYPVATFTPHDSTGYGVAGVKPDADPAPCGSDGSGSIFVRFIVWGNAGSSVPMQFDFIAVQP